MGSPAWSGEQGGHNRGKVPMAPQSHSCLVSYNERVKSSSAEMVVRHHNTWDRIKLHYYIPSAHIYRGEIVEGSA